MSSSHLTRRSFLKVSAAATDDLVITLRLPSRTRAATSTEWKPNAWLKITSDNRIIFILDRVEIDQNVMTSHSMMIAEELEIDPRRLEIEFAPADRAYDNPEIGFQITGDSTSVKGSWQALRQAGAT